MDGSRESCAMLYTRYFSAATQAFAGGRHPGSAGDRHRSRPRTSRPAANLVEVARRPLEEAPVRGLTRPLAALDERLAAGEHVADGALDGDALIGVVVRGGMVVLGRERVRRVRVDD